MHRFVAAPLAMFGLVCAVAAQEEEDVSPYREMKTLARAVELIRQDYVDGDKTEYEELVYSALRGMLADLDPHSDFMDPKDFKGMQEDTRSEFGGLGVVVGLKNERLTIVAPMEGTPGFRAGLLPGDVLLEIDGQSADKMSLRDAVEKLRGEAGTAVKLAVGREGSPEPLKFEIEREVIKVPSVRGARVLPGDGPRVGYVRVTQFSEPTGREFSRALDELEKEGIDALVVDLRFNPGGLLSGAVEVASPTPRAVRLRPSAATLPRARGARRGLIRSRCWSTVRARAGRKLWRVRSRIPAVHCLSAKRLSARGRCKVWSRFPTDPPCA